MLIKSAGTHSLVRSFRGFNQYNPPLCLIPMKTLNGTLNEAASRPASVYERRFVGEQQRVSILLPPSQRLANVALWRSGWPPSTTDCLPGNIFTCGNHGRSQDGPFLRAERADKLDTVPDFLLRRHALEKEFVQVADAGLVCLLCCEIRAINHTPNLLDDQRVVHEEKRLLRNGRLVTLAHR